MTDVLTTVRNHYVKMESNFATLVMGTMVLEGLGKQLDPTLNLIKVSHLFIPAISSFYSGGRDGGEKMEESSYCIITLAKFNNVGGNAICYKGRVPEFLQLTEDHG